MGPLQFVTGRVSVEEIDVSYRSGLKFLYFFDEDLGCLFGLFGDAEPAVFIEKVRFLDVSVWAGLLFLILGVLWV